MPRIFEYHHTVHDDEIDGLGHVNNLEYLRWMQAAAIEHSTDQGWSPQRYFDIGAGWVARSHSIDYLKPAFARDLIVVLTWVAGFRKIQSIRRYQIVRPADDTVLAKAQTNWAFIDIERQAPRRIPPEVADAFEVVSETGISDIIHSRFSER